MSEINANTNISANVNTSANSANSAETAEKVGKLKALLNSFWDFLKSIINHSSIVDRMEQLEKDLDELIATEEINSDMLDELYALTNRVAGRLDTINADNVDEIIKELEDKTAEIVSKSVVNDEKSSSDLIVKFKEILEANTNKEYGKDFKNSFLSKARVIKHDHLEKNKLLVEFNKSILEVTFDISKEDNNSFIQYDIKASKYDYDDIFDIRDILRENVSYIKDIDGNAIHNLNNAVCEANELHYILDKEKEMERLQKLLPQKGLFLQSRILKDVITDNGRYISRFFEEDNSFRIRDTKTNDMVCVKTTAESIDLQIYKDAKSLEDTHGENFNIGGWHDVDGTLESSLFTSKGSVDISAMLRCSEMKECLLYNGISEKRQEVAFQNRRDTSWCKVRPENMHKVRTLQNECQRLVSQLKDGYDVILDDDKNKNSKYTFLNIYDKSGNRISYSFTNTGDVQAVNYIKNAEKKKTVFMYNPQTENVSPDFSKAYQDETFRKLFSTAKDALDNSLKIIKSQENQKLKEEMER